MLHGWFLCTIFILWFWRINNSPVSCSFVCDSSQLLNKNRYALTNHEVISISYISSNFMFSDVDECSTNDHSCGVNAVCTNTVGSYACACKAGYTGDGRTCNGTFVCFKNESLYSNCWAPNRATWNLHFTSTVSKILMSIDWYSCILALKFIIERAMQRTHLLLKMSFM